MNKTKKAAFGILLAGLAFGFSAFTTLKNRSNYYYYKTSMTYPSASDPRGYTYYVDDRCESTGNLCKALWNTGTHPLPSDGEALPLTGVTFMTGSALSGHFE